MTLIYGQNQDITWQVTLYSVDYTDHLEPER